MRGARGHELTTERLRLRAWTEEDRAPFAAMNADPEVMRHFPARMTRAESDAFAARIEAQFERTGWGLWAVERDSAFIGFVGLQPVGFEASFAPAVEIGWRLARPAWGRGYATEAARAVVDFAFAPRPAGAGLAELVSFTTAGNAPSRAVMERLGMTRDPAEDFEHPRLAVGDPLRLHVLYRLSPRERTEGSGPTCRSSGA